MFGDLAMPSTEHSAAILVGVWPSQSVAAWSGFSTALGEARHRFGSQRGTQEEIHEILRPMSGDFITKALLLADTCMVTLDNRIELYAHVAEQASWAANELHATKADLVETVAAAEEKIAEARQSAASAKAANPLAAPQIQAQLEATEQAIVAAARATAQARDVEGAGKVAALVAAITGWTPRHKMPTADGEGGTSGAPAAPHAPQLPHGGGARTTPVDRHHKSWEKPPAELPQQQSQQGEPGRQGQESGWRHPETGKPGTPGGSPSPLSNSPGTGSAPSPGSSGGGSPGSMFNSLMKPMTGGGSSPASSAARGGGLGGPAGAGSGSSAGQLGNANAATPGGAASAGRGGGGGGLAGLGSGIAEVSGRAVSGAISGAANGLGAAGNVGSQVAQNVAAAGVGQASAAAVPPVPPPPTPPSAAAGPPPMAMMPPPAAGGGGGLVSGVGGGAGGPVSTPPPAAVGPAVPGGGSAVSGSAAAAVAPLVSPGVRGIGGETAGGGDGLVAQAMEVGQAVIASLLTQTTRLPYMSIDYAVSVIAERMGSVSAWLATSEGASYIPLGVRVPANVGLALTDPVIGHELFAKATAEGGANALEVVVRHAEAREMAAPGTRVLAIASSLPMEQMVDWVGAVGARPVSVLPEQADSVAVEVPLVHRCAMAMPWEWRQANAFSDQQRRQVAARHMHMAALAGHLHGAACEKVMRLFELRQPIEDALWADVQMERFGGLIEWEQQRGTQGQGGSTPARALAFVRAVEVIECLRHYDTAEGCADLLYAARLAGAPLNPDAAVA